jgi:hypothetical protein
MKTPRRLACLAGWIGRCGIALVALMFCASAVADTSKNVVVPKRTKAAPAIVKKKEIYVFISGSAIPQPIDRIAGPIATTAIPMIVIGNR